MSEKDLSEVSIVDALAFNATKKDGTLRKRTKESLLEAFQVNSEGCFIAVESERICGYIFSRVWGEVGWLGVFGVAPNSQNLGIGQKLLSDAIGCLKEKGCVTIGLETMPESAFNVGFYLKSGFKMAYPTIHFKLSLKLPSQKIIFAPPKQCSPPVALAKKVSQIVKGLNYDIEVKSVENHKWGNILLFGDSGQDGFAILRTKAVHETTNPIPLVVQNMVLFGKEKKLFSQAIQEIEAYAISSNFKEIVISANSLNQDFIDWLLSYGFQVWRTIVRMTYCGEYLPVNGVDASKWGM